VITFPTSTRKDGIMLSHIEGNTSMQHLPQTFRPSFFRIFAVCSALMAIIILLFLPFFWPLQGARASAFRSLIIFAVIWISILSIFGYWLSNVTVQVDGIRGYSFFGTFHFVQWENMHSVQDINLLGLRYLRTTHNESRSPLWIPLFHARQAEFETIVVATAPSSNPLRKKIEEMSIKPLQ
jgi:hypothetical protein